jgi:hypothetical protein
MKLTIPGTDVIVIDEENFDFYKQKAKGSSDKVHLIKLSFLDPTQEKIENILNNFSNTNRFIIDNNIKTYNSLLKNTNKKYYVQNKKGTSIISFLRKNNKILMDLTVLEKDEYVFIKNNLQDLLRNVEIILLEKNDLEPIKETLRFWKGNVIVNDGSYKI